MFMTLHVKDKPVNISLRRVEDFKGVSEFFTRPFEITIQAEDQSFCCVGYCSPIELDTFKIKLEQELMDYDFGKGSDNDY